MPLVRISLMKGKPEDFGQKVGEIVYQAMVDTINVPVKDHFQIITGTRQSYADLRSDLSRYSANAWNHRYTNHLK